MYVQLSFLNQYMLKITNYIKKTKDMDPTRQGNAYATRLHSVVLTELQLF